MYLIVVMVAQNNVTIVTMSRKINLIKSIGAKGKSDLTIY